MFLVPEFDWLESDWIADWSEMNEYFFWLSWRSYVALNYA